MYVPQWPALIRSFLSFFLPFFLPFFAFLAVLAFFFLDFTNSIWLSTPGCEPGLTYVAAFSSGSGENATAIATAKAVMRLFLISISKYLPFPFRRSDTATTRRQTKGERPPCPCATTPLDTRFCKMNAQ